jgi:hypothetical protein
LLARIIRPNHQQLEITQKQHWIIASKTWSMKHSFMVFLAMLDPCGHACVHVKEEEGRTKEHFSKSPPRIEASKKKTTRKYSK